MTKSPVRVGIVGAGIGRIHAETYQKLIDQAEVVALCDADEARLQEVADKFEIPERYTDYAAMFNSQKIEAVSICLPNFLHAPVTTAALEAGLHVLCEKPLAENSAAGQKIVEAAAKAPGKFMMCFNRRYRTDVRWMKKVLDEGTLGQVYQVKAGWIRETGIPRGWFANREMAGGGPLIDLGVHMLDVVMWLLDYPTPLTVSGDVQINFGRRGLKSWYFDPKVAKAFSVEDSATAFIRLAGGAALTLETSWASHARPGKDDFFVTLHGTEGAIEWYVANYATEDTLALHSEVGGVPVTTRPLVKGVRFDHEYAIAEFVRCIIEDSEPTATAEQGQTIMEVIDAIYRSAELGREVALETSKS